jgi:hypothetical protein
MLRRWNVGEVVIDRGRLAPFPGGFEAQANGINTLENSRRHRAIFRSEILAHAKLASNHG